MYIKKYNRNNNSFLPVFIVALIVSLFSMIIGLYMGFLFSEWRLVNTIIQLMPQNKIANTKNILVLGVDNVKGSSRSDTIMLININKSTNQVGVLSIPRDTYVEVEGHGFTKINHAYAYGGVELLKSSLTNFLHVPVDYYIVLDMGGVKQMVDQIGGVNVEVKHRMYYVDRAGDLYINFKPGKQLLDGTQAMGYLRYRHDLGGDIGRISRQQEFVRAVVQKMVAPSQILKLPSVIQGLSKYVQTDLSTGQMLNMTLEIKEAMNKGNINIHTLPGTVIMIGGLYYWKVEEVEAAKLVASSLNGFPSNNVLQASNEGIATTNIVAQKASENQEYSPRNTIERLRQERLEKQKADEELLLKQKEEQANLAKQKKEQERQAALKAEADRKEKEEQERLAVIKATQEKLAKAKAEELRLAAEKTEKERLEKISLSKEKLAKAQLAVKKKLDEERFAKQKTEDERKAKEKAQQERLAKIKDDEDKLTKEKADAERLAQAKAEIAKTSMDSDVSVEILNGNGQIGLASKVAVILRNRGISVLKVGEAAHHNYQYTKIVDWKGKSAEALKLASELHINPANIVKYNLPQKTLDVTLVLGKDWGTLGNN